MIWPTLKASKFVQLPLRLKKNENENSCLLYVKEPDMKYGFNTANYRLIRVHEAEISLKVTEIWWFG